MYSYPMQNIIPQQQVIQANGKASINNLRLAPNSSVLIMDTTAPIVWLCISDGIGNVSSTPYDIAPHKDPESVDVNDVNTRLERIEKAIERMEALHNESDDFSVKRDGKNAEFKSNKTNHANNQSRKKSSDDAFTDDAE